MRGAGGLPPPIILRRKKERERKKIKREKRKIRKKCVCRTGKEQGQNKGGGQEEGPKGDRKFKRRGGRNMILRARWAEHLGEHGEGGRGGMC